jgi:hypothetical protein
VGREQPLRVPAGQYPGIVAIGASASSSHAETADHFQAPVRYWPRRTGLYWWKHGTRDDLRFDFDLAAGFGLTQLQVYLPWAEFQDRADTVPSSPMRSLEMLLDEAAEYSITLRLNLLSVLVGRLLWLPHWTLNPLTAGDRQVFNGRGFTSLEPRKLFTDPQMIDAEMLVVAEVVGEFCSHPAAGEWALDGGLYAASSPDSSHASESWLDSLVTAVRRGGRTPSLSAGLPAREVVQSTSVEFEVYTSLDVSLDIIPMWRPPWARGSGALWSSFLVAFVASMVSTPVMIEIETHPAQDESDDAKRQSEEIVSVTSHGGAGAIGPLLIDPAREVLKTPPYLHGAGSEPGLFRADGSPREAAEVWKRAQLDKKELTRVPSNFPAPDAERRSRHPEQVAQESFEAFAR